MVKLCRRCEVWGLLKRSDLGDYCLFCWSRDEELMRFMNMLRDSPWQEARLRL